MPRPGRRRFSGEYSRLWSYRAIDRPPFGTFIPESERLRFELGWASLSRPAISTMLLAGVARRDRRWVSLKTVHLMSYGEVSQLHQILS